MRPVVTVFLLTLFINLSLGQSASLEFPGELDDPLFIYHPQSKAMLLLGGTPVIQDSLRSDVWKWDDSGWSRIEGMGPGARVFFKGGLNQSDGTIQLFAGAGLARTNSLMDDLWKFDGKTWSRILNNDIGPHDHFKMVYADHLNAFVLYGGSINHEPDTTTWLLKGEKFTRLNTRGAGFRSQSGMVYDKHRKRVVMYGGGDKADELWEFDGTQWEQIITKINPGVKLYHHMAFDENLGAVVLHGGQINHRPLDPKNLVTPSSWLWDGKEWKKVAEENIFPIAIGYHPVRKSVLAYGYNTGDINASRKIQLWEFKNYKWKKIEDYGEWNTLEYLEKYLQHDSENLMALYVYAYKLRGMKRFADAEVVFKKLLNQKLPQKASVWRGLIDVLKSQKKLDETEEYISKYEVFGEKRSVSTMYYNLACDYALSNLPDKAFRALHKASQHGYNVKNDYEKDPDLVSLRSDARWQTLVSTLK